MKKSNLLLLSLLIFNFAFVLVFNVKAQTRSLPTFYCYVGVGDKCNTTAMRPCPSGLDPLVTTQDSSGKWIQVRCEELTTANECRKFHDPMNCVLRTVDETKPSPTPTPSPSTTPVTQPGKENTPGGTNPQTNSNASLINLDQVIDKGLGGFDKNLTSLGGIVTKLLQFIYPIAGAGLLIMLIFGGFSYLTSTGDPKKMEAAKGIITAAVIGFIIVIVAYWVTDIVNIIFGLNVPLK